MMSQTIDNSPNASVTGADINMPRVPDELIHDIMQERPLLLPGIQLDGGQR